MIKSSKPGARRARAEPPARALEKTTSSPNLALRKADLKDVSASEDNLSARQDAIPEEGPMMSPCLRPAGDQPLYPTSQDPKNDARDPRHPKNSKDHQLLQKDNAGRCCGSNKKSRSCSPHAAEEEAAARQLRDIQQDVRRSARIIKDSKLRLQNLQKKTNMTEIDVKELCERNELLLREMERFSGMTRAVQRLVQGCGREPVAQPHKDREAATQPHKDRTGYIPGTAYEPAVHHEMRMTHPSVVLGEGRRFAPHVGAPPTRSISEIDLTRKLSESYDMQEKLVADNADLEVKRYILYKELMTKDQNLETCRAQVKRLQGELKLMGKENTLLQEKLNIHKPQEMGDAVAIEEETPCHPEAQDCKLNEKQLDTTTAALLADKLRDYNVNSRELECHVLQLEEQVRRLDQEMAQRSKGVCRGGAAGPNTCFEQQPGFPPVPPMTRACGVCPPCPAPCNPAAPPTPAERELAKITLQLQQTEEGFKTKVAECAMLRVELLNKKDELEKERCQHREAQNRLRELEMKFEGLTTTTNMMLGSKEQAFEQEVNVRALKQCYREAREEIGEVRTLLKEQNDQLQDYRVKYLSAQQLVEEQRRQMDMMDMDNTRISEQINLEIQRVKLKFQEKLQELAPIPDLLKATQLRLKDAQQSQALAEHNAENLARELNVAREKVHMLLHNALKPPKNDDQKTDKAADEKQLAMAQQRIAQLQENTVALKGEIERLKTNVIRMEEGVLANEKRLQEKMHECAQLGGELDRARDEAARALARANERTDTIRKCMQTTVAELERQLAATRAQVSTAEKEREEVQNRMNCQIKRLGENFEQAQLRIFGLQTQVQRLRRTSSSTGEGNGDGDDDLEQCNCKTLFDNP